MSDDLLVALQITAVGMGLVFGMICALWLGMALLVRLTADPLAPTVEPAPEARAESGAAERELRQRAAAAAVAVALAELRPAPPEPPPTAAVSPWQAVARGNQLRQRGRVR